jgi:hypothetical protein
MGFKAPKIWPLKVPPVTDIRHDGLKEGAFATARLTAPEPPSYDLSMAGYIA